MPPRSTFQRRSRMKLFWGVGLSLVGIALALGTLWGPSFTYKGVPVGIIFKFLQDDRARSAYWSGNREVLHDRLQELNVEAEIKTFYRPQIPDETQLDQHIHQIFYEATGYIGKAYELNGQGILVLRDRGFERWFPLAYRAGVVVASDFKDGVPYVVSPDGVVAAYADVAKVFPVQLLEEMIKAKDQALP
ncbi:MAG: hypothetical protein HC934_12380 [Acaryochloridaceae cyanobacterium SU_2_1]|nr:hypothetical protein [Acaryochloridaceae cyanobacterium SU_2_1]NJM94995.1 hypothetical protein [Acaryochloridaceae cyanobacterium CSU_5_19]